MLNVEVPSSSACALEQPKRQINVESYACIMYSVLTDVPRAAKSLAARLIRVILQTVVAGGMRIKALETLGTNFGSTVVALRYQPPGS